MRRGKSIINRNTEKRVKTKLIKKHKVKKDTESNLKSKKLGY